MSLLTHRHVPYVISVCTVSVTKRNRIFILIAKITKVSVCANKSVRFYFGAEVIQKYSNYSYTVNFLGLYPHEKTL